VAKEQLTRLIRKLSPEELKVLSQIPEPETFKIGEDDLLPEVLKILEKK